MSGEDKKEKPVDNHEKCCRKRGRKKRSCAIPGWLYNNPGIEQKIKHLTHCWREVEEQLNDPHARIGKKHK